jgi:DNA-binding transcriptional LysR family regulator
MALPKTSLEQWSILAAVVDHGGFARAAQHLNRSQSAVSYAVAKLQEAIGLPLLAIEGRKSVLTPHGRTLLTRARPLLRDLDTLESLGSSLRRGWEPELKLVVDAAFPRADLLRIIAELQITCPRTQIQLSDAVLSGADDAIVSGVADLVVTSRVPPGFLADLLMQVEFLPVARADHPLCKLDRDVAVTDLARHTQAVVRDSGLREPRDEGWLGAEHRFTVSSMDASLATLLAGLAYAWLPSHVVDADLTAGRLQRLRLTTGGSRLVSLYLVRVRPELIGPAGAAAVAAFMRHAQAYGPQVGAPLQ